MGEPHLSEHARQRKPSAIRVASIQFQERNDGVRALNVAIGNVSLPMHPAMVDRLRSVGQPGQPFADGVVRYTSTVGEPETRQAFLRILEASGFSSDGVHAQITDGGSQAMELAIAATCGAAGSTTSPLLLIDASYTNYQAFADRLGRATTSIRRELQADGRFTLPPMDEISRVVKVTKPGALVVIPYDNPTGHFYDTESLARLAQVCCDENMWLISDEAYRELHYGGQAASSVWGISEADVPGIGGRRISIETSSKIWNACGLRIGALLTDSAALHRACVAEYTANLCPNTLGQHIFGALAEIPAEELRTWFAQQRAYYGTMLREFCTKMSEALPGTIVGNPDASLYSVVDLRAIAPSDFDAAEFVRFCASEGAVDIAGERMTLLTAPMAGFYHCDQGEDNPGRTQMRIAFVLPPEEMRLVPVLFAQLFRQYCDRSC
jgi:aspartate aminotransferase